MKHQLIELLVEPADVYDRVKVSELTLPLQHGAERRARTLLEMVEEDDGTVGQWIGCKCDLPRWWWRWWRWQRRWW